MWRNVPDNSECHSYNLYLQVNSKLLFTSHWTMALISPDSHMKAPTFENLNILQLKNRGYQEFFYGLEL